MWIKMLVPGMIMRARGKGCEKSVQPKKREECRGEVTK